MSLQRKRALDENLQNSQNINEKSTKDDNILTKKPVFRYENIARFYNAEPGEPHINIPRKPSAIVIGRSSSCDIKIVGGDVSSKHCQLTITNNNQREYLYIVDISSNGLYVNDEKLGKGPPGVLLRSGDKISFAKTGGSYIVRYMADIVSSEQSKTYKKTFFEDYIIGNQLGSGHYAVVKEARDRSTGDVVAVKIFHPNKQATSNWSQEEAKLQQEMNLLLSIDHPNIVRFISHYIEPINQHSVATYLVLEKMNSGELFQRIINKGKLRENETKAFFKQLLSGLSYLHENNIIHRDIKPENILLDITPRTSKNQKQTGPWDEKEYDVRVKIADFGLAKFIGELKFTNTLCGTPAYVAPEVLKNDRNYSTKVDMWSTGVLLYVCLCGFPPFSDELGPPSMKEQILNGIFAFFSPYWDDIDDVVLDLISSLLAVDVGDRFDVKQTLAHEWFADGQKDVTDVTDDSAGASYFDSIQSIPSKKLIVRSNSQPQAMSIRDRFLSDMNLISDTERSSIL
ncbi:protein kinase [Scheffersomyces stipitis CBS 6054]|uniref:Protein kinase n=1 Tax=Scheffersomyces stipitis (strain ATCC 58785 / CBS 6054 / NBRC 10063 / NRRL Y-11545) TaxID=322104 RepID=A3LNN2_PICST|nr:protein kinase [Scheffersomyces stipitis CBS 6054]ABN64358.2 protein kinase [Scheffersomyces stipitis CBS 6054]KAG2736819.1 hypothetical protein G9P44_000909 [Scheffersomyces stipitis]